jgi:uncharacterized protein YjiS (DUF1127 family)
MKTSPHSLSSREFVCPVAESSSARRTFVGRKVLQFLTKAVAEWRRRARARRQFQSLCLLDDRTLQDIGLTRSQANFEATRTIWWR